jgi:hypothetical protein
MRVLVCGSRSWTDYSAIERALSQLVEERGRFVVMHGAARGADRLGGGGGRPPAGRRAAGPPRPAPPPPPGAARRPGAPARRRGAEVVEYPADWKRHGRRAGYLRNEQMLAAGPDLVVAFHRDSSRGTAHTISLARKAGIDVVVYRR